MPTGATTNWSIPLYGDTDTVTPIQAPFNAQANALDTALTTAVNSNAFRRFTTQALMIAAPGTAVGQHATVYADSTTANNGDYVWSGSGWLHSGTFGIATGVITAAANTSGVVTLTFPTGRFTVAPILFFTATNFVANAVVGLPTSVTATGGTVNTFNVSTGANLPGVAFTWLAIQMNSASAAG